MTYGFVIKSAGPMKNCEIAPMSNPPITNFLAPYISVYAVEPNLQTIIILTSGYVHTHKLV